MPAPCHPMIVANSFPDLARKDREPLTAMKLQKLIYFAQGQHLAERDLPLLDQPIEAWEFRPVSPPVYYSLLACGTKPLDLSPRGAAGGDRGNVCDGCGCSFGGQARLGCVHALFGFGSVGFCDPFGALDASTMQSGRGTYAADRHRQPCVQEILHEIK